MPDPGLPAFLVSCAMRLEACLEQWLPAANTHPSRLHDAMRYAVLDGGKRIRPTLVYASGQAVGADPELMDAPAAAVELIHAYSLVHDDLPAMDDDDLRRGKPSCHRAYDEATAILAGDALQALAFHLLAHHASTRLPAAVRLQMLERLAGAAGSRGMAGGQAIDLAATGRSLNIAELEDMHIHKTGALVRVSVLLGAMCGAATSPQQLEQLDHYAKCIGLAFQIRDDVLDVEGEVSALGKNTGMDQQREKSTYPALMGLDSARQRARELHEEALRSLAGFGPGADPLRWISAYVIERER